MTKSLGQIEERILEIKKATRKAPDQVDEELRKSGTVLRPEYESRIEAIKAPLLKECEILEIQRQFLLDRREGWLPKTIWNLIVLIIAAFITTLITSRLLF